MAVQREQVIRTAEKYVSKGRIEAAIREYRKVLKDHPSDTNTLNRLGDLYARVQRFEEAVELFERIAEGYTQDGFFVKAIAIYKKIIKLDPTHLGIYEKLAELYHKQGLVNEARTQYQVLADYYLKHDDTRAALGIYLKMVDLEPDNPSHHARLAELYTQRQQLAEAMAEYATIAELMIGHGHPGEAARVYLRALDVDASDLDFITEAVTKLKEAEQIAEAARFLAAAVERNPGAQSVARRLGLEPEPRAPARAATAVGKESPAIEEEPVAEEPVAREEVPPAGEGPAGPEEGVDLVLDLDAEALPEALGEAEPAVAEAAVELPPAQADIAPQEAVAAPGATGEIEIDLDEVFALDLDDDEPPASQVQPPPDMLDGRPARAFADLHSETASQEPAESMPAGAEGPEPLEIDTDFLERTAAELQDPTTPTEVDLVSEAEVLAKYGLEDKAVERLEQALKLNPRLLEAHDLLIRIHLEESPPSRVAHLAQRMASAAAESGGSEVWERTRKRLEAAEFQVLEGRVVPPTARRRPAQAAGDGVDRLLQDLLVDSSPRPRPATRPSSLAPPASPAPEVEAGWEEAEAAAGAAGAPVAPGERIPESPEDFTLHGIFDELKQSGALAPSSAEAPAGEPESREAAASQDAGTSWLDEVDAHPAAEDEVIALFEGEEEFFDLAGELDKELTKEASLDEREPLIPGRDQSLEEIVEGFKKGVAEALSPKDYSTHFDLGIAYREMGLLDEAIGEFQIAAKDRSHLVECCSMLGLCFREKGLPELAVKWYRQGLSAADLGEEETLGLLYDMGELQLFMDDREAAYKTFVEIYGINSNYRDVVAKLEELRAAGQSSSDGLRDRFHDPRTA